MTLPVRPYSTWQVLGCCCQNLGFLCPLEPSKKMQRQNLMALILTRQRTQHAHASRTVSPHHAESRGSHSWGSQSGFGDKERSVRILSSSFFLHCFKTVRRLTAGHLGLEPVPVAGYSVFCGLHGGFLSVIQQEGKASAKRVA